MNTPVLLLKFSLEDLPFHQFIFFCGICTQVLIDTPWYLSISLSTPWYTFILKIVKRLVKTNTGTFLHYLSIEHKKSVLNFVIKEEMLKAIFYQVF